MACIARADRITLAENLNNSAQELVEEHWISVPHGLFTLPRTPIAQDLRSDCSPMVRVTLYRPRVAVRIWIWTNIRVTTLTITSKRSPVTLTSLSNIRATTPVHLRRAPQASAHLSAHRCWAPPIPAPIVKGPPLPWTLRPYSSPFFSPALTAAARLTMETLHRMINRLRLHRNPVPARSLQLACSPSCGPCASGNLFS